MSSFSTTQNTANDDGPQARWGAPPWATGRNGPPLPIKIAVVAVAFAIFKPLALVAAGYFLLRGRFNGKCSPCSRRGGPLSRTSGNSVFDDHKRETLDRLRDEEKAFADFEANKRKAEDKQAFVTFMAARNAPSDRTDEAPKS